MHFKIKSSNPRVHERWSTSDHRLKKLKFLSKEELGLEKNSSIPSNFMIEAIRIFF
jgi:hypothetical protein